MNIKRPRALQIIRDSTVKGYCQSAMLVYEKSLERKRLKLKYAWQLMFIVNYRPSQKRTSWQTAHRWYAWWLRSLQVRAMHKLSSRDSAHVLAMKLSPCMCSYSSFPD